MARSSNRSGPGKHKHRRRLYILLGLTLSLCGFGLLGYERRVQVSSSTGLADLLPASRASQWF